MEDDIIYPVCTSSERHGCMELGACGPVTRSTQPKSLGLDLKADKDDQNGSISRAPWSLFLLFGNDSSHSCFCIITNVEQHILS